MRKSRTIVPAAGETYRVGSKRVRVLATDITSEGEMAAVIIDGDKEHGTWVRPESLLPDKLPENTIIDTPLGEVVLLPGGTWRWPTAADLESAAEPPTPTTPPVPPAFVDRIQP